ncbi:MAG TPA: hypothetical protein VMD77_10265 [Candidatus Baltobacteraceae bacterium]|nr:hypothetical protein [Candidatus Baltobacteraceae bacterium]
MAPGSDDRRQQMIAIAVCLVACLLVAGMVIAWKLHEPAPSGNAPETTAPSAAADLAAPAKPAANLPVAPGVIATEEELAKPWSSKRFVYHDPMLDLDVPAVVVRLPQGGYWGFSLIEPFGTCEMEYVTNLQRLQTVYDFQSDHPMVGDPCDHAVFDLLQWGGPPSAEVRGAPVRGMGVRPPLAIEIVQRGKEILATKIE